MTLSAQAISSGVLSGTVLDSSGAVVPGAKLTVSSDFTGLSRDSMSDERGEFRFVLLPPGVYDLRVEKAGFTTANLRKIEITVGQDLHVDVKLSVGQSTQVVDVEGTVPLVETERTQQSNTIGQQEVRDLPINRRDYLSFTLLAPGIVDSKALADANSFRVKQTPDSGISFYGSNGRGNNISVDGGEANDPGGGVRATVSQEAVREFQINRTNYSAEHGAARGGVVNIVTRSGSNQIRGSVFGFFRHQDLDAGDPFAIALVDNRTQRVKPPANRQQFGGTVGGPIRKDRTFYFLSYEQLRRRESNTVPVLTDPAIFQPTPDQERILSALPPAAAGQLRAALSSPPSTVELFRRNSGIFPFRTDDYKGLLRLDHRFNDNNSAFFRYNITDAFETNQNVQALVGVSRGFVTSQFESNALGAWTHTFSPTVLNDARVQFAYYDLLTESNERFGPALEIAGFGFFNRDRFLPAHTISRRTELRDDLSLQRGAHSIKLGAYTLIRNNVTDSKTFMSGRFTFGTLPGAFVSPALATTTINALQAFNLGLAQSYQQGFGDGVVKAIHPLYAGYFQDQWKVASNFTFNLGVRYEVDTRKAPLPTEKNNVAPRAGFAWDPFKDNRTSIRGGYGLFFAPIDFQIDYVVNALNEIGGFRQIAQVLTVLNPANPLAVNGPINIFQRLRAQNVIGVPTPQRPIQAEDLRQFGINVSQRGPRPPLTVLFRPSPDYQNPYAQQASFEIQRELVKDVSLSAAYIFTRGAKLTTSRDTNLLPAPVNPVTGVRDWGPTPANPTGTAFFVDPLLFQENQYEATANSIYHGLILELTKRFSRNIGFNVNYTFSKAIDETTDYNSDFQPNDQTCRRCERSLSSFDQRHKFVAFGMIRTPAGDTAVRKAFANIAFMPIFRANSGRPFNLLAGTELNNDRHNTTDRPFFAGRNTGIGPSFWTFDLRITRRVTFADRRVMEFIAEGFNLFNNLNLATVNNTVGNITGDFRLTGRHDRTPLQPLGFTSAFEPRRIQLGFRLNF